MCKLLRKLGLALLKIADALDLEVTAYDDSNIDTSKEVSVDNSIYEDESYSDYSYDNFLDESKKFDECLVYAQNKFVYELNKQLRDCSHLSGYTTILNTCVIGRSYNEIIESCGSSLASKLDAMVRQYAICRLNSQDVKFNAPEYFILYMIDNMDIVQDKESEMCDDYYKDIYDL